jgi:ribonuclease T2
MKFFWLTEIIFFIFTTSAIAQQIKRDPGRFDHYVLALSWQPAFCEFHATTPECRSQNESRYDATHLVLHGLWPSVRGDTQHDYEYCGVARDLREKDRSKAWCDLPSPDLTEESRKRLSALMPGLQSCLERHEWFRHGTCSGLSGNDYFEKAMSLTEHLSKTQFSAYITSNVGKRVSLSGLLSTFDKDFGAGSSRGLALLCDSKHGASMLTEVRLYLKKERLGAPLSRESFTQAEPSAKGSCKKQIAIDSVGLQTSARPSGL